MTTTNTTAPQAHQRMAAWLGHAHRLSGVGLALFLPLHFWMLGHAIAGEFALNRMLRLVDLSVFKVAEWILCVLLSVHLAGGLQLLASRYLAWHPSAPQRLAWGGGFCLLLSLVFAWSLYA